LPRLSSTNAALLRQALGTTFRHPSLLASFNGSEDVVPPAAPPANAFNPAPAIGGDGTISVTLPLVVAFRLGGAPGAGGAVPFAPDLDAPQDPLQPEPVIDAPIDSVEAEAFTPDPQYPNRKGYNRTFLGTPVPLPKLGAAQRAVAARNLKAKPNDDPFEIKYQHFSAVMNGERRLAFFTAGNTDGSSVVKINRQTGKVTSVESFENAEEFEASEKWFEDPRIDPKHGTNQKLYSSADFRNFFQRGHLVKRTDPSWGTVDKARRGQADTFHFVNCAPQHKGFNPVQTRWAGVEDWITNGSDDDDLRVSIFTGCVFRDDDPVFDTIRVPREYWKIVARVEDGELLATAILADQTDLLGLSEAFRESAGPEDLPDFPDKLPDEYQVTIAEIEELTGLDFGLLREHDTFADASEGLRSRRKLESFQDISVERPRERESSPPPPRRRR
jgi:endonuclease G